MWKSSQKWSAQRSAVRSIEWLGLRLTEVFRLHPQEAVRAEKCNDFTVAAHPKGTAAFVGKALPCRARRRAPSEDLLHFRIRESRGVRASETLALADAVDVADANHEAPITVAERAETTALVKLARCGFP